MGNLVKTVLMMLAEMRLVQRISRFSGALKWMILAALSGLGAGIALIAALWLFLIPRIGADAAALTMAAVFALLTLVFALLARTTLHPQRKPHAEKEDDSVADIKDMFSRHKGSALVSAVLAGIAMGNGKK